MIIRNDSLEYVYATVTADHDLTASTVDVAFPTANTAPVTWYPAENTGCTQTSMTPARYTMTYRILIGPGGATQLGAGNYDWTVRITDTPGPEKPVRKTGSLQVTTT